MRRIRSLSAAIGCAVLAAGAAHAIPDEQSQTLIAALKHLDERVAAGAAMPATAAPPSAAVLIAEMLQTSPALADILRPQALAGPMGQTAAPAAATGALEVQRLNMRLALTMLTQAYGSDDNGAVLNAQTMPDQDALVIRSGNATLADIRRIVQDVKLQRIATGEPLALSVPLIIWAGASLTLRPGDLLHLSRPDGAFVVNFGNLDIQGATIATTGGSNPRSPNFVPFVTTADGGTMQVRGGHFSGLGFGSTLKFSGLSVMGNALRPAGQSTWIDASTFDDLMTLSVGAANGIILRGNHFRNMRGPGLVVSHSRKAQITGNLFTGTSSTNAIRVEQGSGDGQIAGNVILGGKRAGIVVRTGSTGVAVVGNIIWHRDGSGITLSKSNCGRVHDNLMIDNGQKGLEVRFSLGTEVWQNTILGNRSAGVWVSAQPKGALTFLHGNKLAGNGSGLSSAGGESIRMDGNDFTGQFPQFLSGDLALHSTELALNLRGHQPMTLSAAGGQGPAPAGPVCPD